MHAESLESTKRLELLEERLSRVGSRERLLNKKFEICCFQIFDAEDSYVDSLTSLNKVAT